MLGFLAKLHNRRPVLWTVVAFIVVIALATTMSVWWNYLLIENNRILQQMTAAAAAAERNRSSVPLALLMILGLASSIVMVLGLVYMFLRLIRAVRLNLAQSQFIAAVTHELRSPVASLQLMLETIRDPRTPPAKRKEFEDCMLGDLVRLRSLVDRVLETARLESFQTAFVSRMPRESLDSVDLRQLVDGCVAALRPQLLATEGHLHMPEGNQPLLVRANAHLLATALGSVLDNAVKYSVGAADITLRLNEEKGKAFVEVEDKGIGISREELKRVFKRFYRASDPESRSKPGTGLGLYFARLALRAQGGDITVQSPGRGLGTVFRIEVPRV